jgi:phage regulator Rha-like protein
MPKAKLKVQKLIPEEVVINKIYIVRGVKVMLDKDLATMYEVETNYLKRQVNRNIERFPVDFMFQLSKEENDFLRSQIGILEKTGRGQHSKYLPYAFTEQGVAMLSGVVNSPKAINMNIAIMRAFIEMRKLSSTNKIIYEKLKKIEDKLGTHDSQFAQIYEAFENLLDEKVEKEHLKKDRKRIGFRPDD